MATKLWFGFAGGGADALEGYAPDSGLAASWTFWDRTTPPNFGRFVYSQPTFGFSTVGPVNTVNGPTSGLFQLANVSAPISAAFTLSGTVTFAATVFEFNALGDAGAVARLYRLGYDGTLTLIVNDAKFASEITPSSAQRQWTATPTSTSMRKGDRLICCLGYDDMPGGTMVAGTTLRYEIQGATPGGEGDTYVQITETATFDTTGEGFGRAGASGSGTVYRLTDAASSIADQGSTVDEKALTPVAQFAPASTLLDDYTRANQNPVTGNWTNKIDPGDANMKIVSNHLETAGGTAAWGSAWWNPTTYKGEAFCSFTNHKVDDLLRVYACIQNPGTSSWSGYVVELQKPNADPRQQMVSYVVNSGSFSVLSGLNVDASGTGDVCTGIGISVVDSFIVAWCLISGVWRPSFGWGDSTYTTAGYSGVGIFSNDNTMTVDDFGSSNVSVTTAHADMATVNGPTSPLAWTKTSGGHTVEWYTRQLTGFTLSGRVRVRLSTLGDEEGGTYSGGAHVGAELAVVNNDGTGAVVYAATPIVRQLRSLFSSDYIQSMYGYFGIESTGPPQRLVYANLWGPDITVTTGQRLRLRLFMDEDYGGPLGTALTSGHTNSIYYDGYHEGPGDSHVWLPQAVTDIPDPTAPVPLPHLAWTQAVGL